MNIINDFYLYKIGKILLNFYKPFKKIFLIFFHLIIYYFYEKEYTG
jgi:hypothetical protein